jgi:hypothetical protein
MFFTLIIYLFSTLNTIGYQAVHKDVKIVVFSLNKLLSVKRKSAAEFFVHFNC